MTSIRPRSLFYTSLLAMGWLGTLHAQDGADPASRAFEEGRWEDVISENRRILEGYSEDRTAYLRIAQAERELGRYEAALQTLARAAAVQAPPAMVDLERARNLLLLGRRDEAIVALLDSDHNALRAYRLLEEHSDFDAIRGTLQFREVLRNVRARVYPCETLPEFEQFDFWLGTWEVRTPAGALQPPGTSFRHAM